MSGMRFLSIAEQVANYLQSEILRGRWSETLPGLPQLSKELSINPKTVTVALRQLEKRGLLVPQGAGKRRRIVLPEDGWKPRPLRIAILSHEPLALTQGYMIELQHLLHQAGHGATFAGKSLIELRMDVDRVASLVRQTQADAWVVVSGSKEILEWFTGQGIPVFALFGRRRGLPIAGVGPNKERIYREIVRHLAALGHRRMVLLALGARRLPQPGASERAFLEELAAQGIPASQFNLPDWEPDPEGLQQALDSLFRVTPPTALLIDEAYVFHAVKHHLSRQGIEAPEDVSLICTDPDGTFVWCRPSIAHIAWDNLPVVRRVVRWAKHVSQGKNDIRQSLTPARLVEGGTIGPAEDVIVEREMTRNRSAAEMDDLKF